MSRVYNEPENVSSETLERVRAAAAELQYAPSSLARSLRSGRSGMIALLVGDIAQPFHGALAQAVADVARRRGLRLMLFDLGHSPAQLAAVLRDLPRQAVDGAIIATADNIDLPEVGAAIQECRAARLSVVLGVPSAAGVQESAGAVEVDHAAGVGMALAALADRGSTRPVVLLGAPGGPLAQRMAAGIGSARALSTAYDFDSTRAAVRGLTDVDGIVAATTPMALGALAAFAETGRVVPVVVCEEVPLASQVTPALSTAAVDPRDIAHEMLRLLTDDLDGRHPQARPLRPQLIRRDSC